MLFRPAKWSSKKVEKNRHFAKRLVHGFSQKIDLFLCVLLSKESQKETFFDIVNRKACFLDLKSEVLAKPKKSTFCKAFSPSWFLSKNRPFSLMFFLSKKSQRETFFNILNRKECFLDHNRKVLKNSKKIDILQRGKSMVFVKTSTFSFYVFFEQTKPERNFFWSSG